MATINNGTTTYTPDLILGWTSQADARSVEHVILGVAGSVFTIRAAGPAAGTLAMFFNTLAAAQAVVTALRVPAVWTLNMAPEAAITFQFVTAPGGSIALEAATEQGSKWVVRADYRERT